MAPTGKDQRPSNEWDEYKLIQEKIDKIGAFSFQAKGWSVTLVAGVLVASKQANLGVYAAAITVPLVLLFWAFDAREQLWRRALYTRAEELERHLTRQASRSIEARMTAPVTVRSVGQAMRNADRNLQRTWLGRRIRASDKTFHWVQLIVAIAVPICLADKSTQSTVQISVNAPKASVLFSGGAAVVVPPSSAESSSIELEPSEWEGADASE